MKLRNLCVIALLCVLASAQTPKGTVPRSSADRYPAHARQNDVAIGARLLSQKEAEKAFATEVNRCCVVVEVALYPQKDGQVKVLLNERASVTAGLANEVEEVNQYAAVI